MLSTVTADEASLESRLSRLRTDSKFVSLCMYLRPMTVQELSLEELYDRVSRLAGQCRCKAC